MHISEVLADAFGRVREQVTAIASGLGTEELHWRPNQNANSIAWLLWHLTRIQDDHVAGVAGTEQLWTAGGWFDRFGLRFDRSATGYGFTASEVEAVRVDSPQLLVDYHDAVASSTVAWLANLDDDAYERVVDHWRGEPITLGVRLVSVVDDDAQHIGQAAYVRGLLRKE
jgi:uncharacterized damage-inducible protein DinB